MNSRPGTGGLIRAHGANSNQPRRQPALRPSAEGVERLPFLPPLFFVEGGGKLGGVDCLRSAPVECASGHGAHRERTRRRKIDCVLEQLFRESASGEPEHQPVRDRRVWKASASRTRVIAKV